MFKTHFSSALLRLLCFVAFALCFGHAANAQTRTVIGLTALDPSPEGSDVRFRLTLSQPATQRLSVNFFTRPGFGPTGAQEFPNGPFDSDYNQFFRTFTFETGTTDLIVNVPTKQDSTYEFDETFTVFLQSPRFNGQANANVVFQNGSTFQSNDVTGVILNDDAPPTVSLIAPPPILEGDSNNLQRQNDNFTINLSAIAERPITLSLSTTDGSATSSAPNADYVPVNAEQVTIASGTIQQPYSVVVLGDDIYEGDEAFSLTSSFVPSTPGTTSSTAVAVIQDNDLPFYNIDSSLGRVVEGQPASFRISLVDKQGQPVSSLSNIVFNYVFQDITATFGINPPSPSKPPFDYTDGNTASPYTGAGSQGTFTIRPGQRDFLLPVPTVDDNIQEQIETFRLVINSAPGTNAPLGNGNLGFGEITDNDSAPQITVADTNVIEGTGTTPTSMVFTVSLTSVTSQPITVDYQTVAQNPGVGIADPTSDYVTTNGRVTFAPNQASATFTIPIVADSINEPDETLRVRLFNPGNATFSNNAAEIFAFGTIIDDDTAGTVSMAQAGADVAENVTGGFVNILVNFAPNGVPARPVTVDFTTIPGTALQAGQRDYFGKTGRLTFQPRAGNTSLAIPIEIIDDNIFEGDENFTVRLTAVNGATLLPNATDTLVRIIDNEALPKVRITPADARVSENAGNQQFNVFLLNRSQAPVTVNYAFVDGTATNGVDYAGTDGSFTFLPGGDNSFAIPYSVNDDNIAEGNETFTLQLTGQTDTNGLTNFAFENGRDRINATIVDNDRTPDLTIGDASAPEGSTGDITNGSVLTFPVSLSRPSSKDSSFTFSTLNLRTPDCVPANGCDVASNTDYAVARNVVVTIPAGATTASIVVRVAPDALNEYNEQFAVVARALVNLVPSVSTGANPRFGSVAYGTIVNDDAGGAITLTGPFTEATGAVLSGNLTEGYKRDANNAVIGSVGNFRVTLPAPAGRVVTVTYTIAGSATLTESDINDLTTGPGKTGALTGKVSFFAGDTTRNISLRAAADNLKEDPENLNVTISIVDNNGGNSYTAPSAPARTVIVDRTPSVASFAPTAGFPAYGTVAATRLTVNGQLLRTDGNPRIDAVLFNGGTVERGGITYTSDGAFTVSVPRGARSGPLTFRLVDKTTVIAVPVATNATAIPFYVQPVIDSFTPASGVANVTMVTINGRNFQDGLNPVTAVQFNNISVPVDTTNAGAKVVSDTQIRVLVPAGVAPGPLRIVTANAGVGPASLANFSGVGASGGSLRFGANPDANPILEGSIGNIDQPVRNFNGTGATTFHQPYLVFINPATQTSGPNVGQPLTPQTPITVRISVTSNDVANRTRAPEIAVRGDLTAQGRPTFLVLKSTDGIVDVKIPSTYNTASPLEVAIVDAGTDNQPPVIGGASPTVTVKAAIIASDSPGLFAVTTVGQEPSISVERRQVVTNANQTVVVYGAGTTNDISVPYATDASGTVSQSDAFSGVPPVSADNSVRNYTVYRFDVSNQVNNRVIGGDFKALANGERLQRGVGYRLVVGDRDVRLNARGATLQTAPGRSFALNLTRNIPLAATASNAVNATNGYNFIGFPFDNTQFGSVNFNNSTVTVDGATRSLTDAIAAGLINGQLFTVDASGALTPVTGDPVIQPFKAYFVQAYRDNLTLTLNNPVQ